MSLCEGQGTCDVDHTLLAWPVPFMNVSLKCCLWKQGPRVEEWTSIVDDCRNSWQSGFCF